MDIRRPGQDNGDIAEKLGGMKMRRDSTDAKIERNAWRAKLLHRCWNCHASGLKPGVLETATGDYGIRDYYGTRYSELSLNEQGLCGTCAAQIPAEYRQDQSEE